MFRLLIFITILSALNVHASGLNTCADYSNSSKAIFLSDERKTTFNVDPSALGIAKGILTYALPYAQFLCSQIAKDEQQECNLIAMYLLSQAMNCVTKDLTVKEIRPLATVFCS